MKMFENNQNLIEACVKFYGEEYRKQIVKKLREVKVIDLSKYDDYKNIVKLNLKNQKYLDNNLFCTPNLIHWQIDGVRGQYCTGITQKDTLLGIVAYYKEVGDHTLLHELNHYLSSHKKYIDDHTAFTTVGIIGQKYDLQKGTVETNIALARYLNELINEYCTLQIEKNLQQDNSHNKLALTTYQKCLLFIHEIFDLIKESIIDCYMQGQDDAIREIMGDVSYDFFQENCEQLLIRDGVFSFKENTNTEEQKNNSTQQSNHIVYMDSKEDEDDLIEFSKLIATIEDIYQTKVDAYHLLASIQGKEIDDVKIRQLFDEDYELYRVIGIINGLQDKYRKLLEKQKDIKLKCNEEDDLTTD